MEEELDEEGRTDLCMIVCVCVCVVELGEIGEL